MADYPREPRNYELMVILLPELADEALTETIDRVSGYIANVGGDLREVLQDSPWGRRRLAYTIRFNGTDYRDGYYAIWHFSSIPSALGDLERDLKLDTSVIRHLLVIEDPKWGSPQEREAVREAANAPAEAEVAADGSATEVEVAESPVVPAAPAPAGEVAEEPAAATEDAAASESVEVAADVQPDPIEEQVELEQTAEVAEESASAEAADSEATEEEK